MDLRLGGTSGSGIRVRGLGLRNRGLRLREFGFGVWGAMVKGVAFGFRRTCKGLDGFGCWIMCSGFSLSIQLQLSMSEIKRFFFVYPTECCRDSVGFLGSSPELFFVSRVRCSVRG